MKRKDSGKGFSLIELMIVITIVAILIGLAVPSYARYVRKASRGEAHQLLLNWANNQEIWRAAHTTYANGTALVVPTHANYTFTVAGTSSTAFTLTATPKSDQTKDEERGASCDPLTLNQSNDKTPANCW